MFTGLIEEVGIVEVVAEIGDGRRFRIAAGLVLDGLRMGDSVSVDGACHTVTAIHPDSFEIQSVATTLGRTTVGSFEPGRRVNLERALRLGDRLGGHLVQGHVDAVGEIVSVDPREGHLLIDFTLPEIVRESTILHGSITVSGVSLTVNALPSPGVGQVSIIPHTLAMTNLGDLRPGGMVNLEGDLIGKYVRNLIAPRPGEPSPYLKHVREIPGYESA